MKTILAFCLAFAVVALPARAQEETWDARIAGVSGEVTVQPVDGSPEVSGAADMPLEEGDVVVVSEGGSAEIALDGGSLITVREKSELKIEKAAKGDSRFFLAFGSLLAKISKLGASRMHVRTHGAVAAVRGTEFGVEVDGEHTHVGVFDEGKVEVTGAEGGAPELLISNQETSVKKGAGPLRAEQLKRFTAHRAVMRGHGRRLAAIKAKWKAMPPELRREHRRKALERMREHRKKFIEKRAAQRQKVEDKRRQNAESGRQRRQENLRKMDERRNNINRRREKR
jgi:hypothetical protein